MSSAGDIAGLTGPAGCIGQTGPTEAWYNGLDIYVKRPLFDTHEFLKKHEMIKATPKAMKKMGCPQVFIDGLFPQYAPSTVYICKSCWKWEVRYARVRLPIFKMDVKCKVKYSDIATRKFNIFDRQKARAVIDLSTAVDASLIKLL